jgi:type VI secretion system secreted protein VgrG
MSIVLQMNRPLELATSVGDAELILVALKGREAVSECFWFDLELISDDRDINVADVIAKPLTVNHECSEGVRYFNGFVSEFMLRSGQHERPRYKARIVPWLWFLTRTARLCNSRRYTTISSFGTDIRNVELPVPTAFGPRCKTYPY